MVKNKGQKVPEEDPTEVLNKFISSKREEDAFPTYTNGERKRDSTSEVSLKQAAVFVRVVKP